MSSENSSSKVNSGGGTEDIVVLFLMFLVLGFIGYLAWYLYKNFTEKEDEEDKKDGSSIPSPRPEVTINGQTFDPTGYTVSKGFFWNRQDIPGYIASVAATDDECRNRCVQSPTCAQFARAYGSSPGAPDDRKCYISESNNHVADSMHIRAIKKGSGGTKNYSDPTHMELLRDMAYESPVVRVNAQQCADMCTRASSPSCIAWTYRTNDHTNPALRQTCILGKNSANQQYYYADGLIDRPIRLPAVGNIYYLNGIRSGLSIIRITITNVTPTVIEFTYEKTFQLVSINNIRYTYSGTGQSWNIDTSSDPNGSVSIYLGSNPIIFDGTNFIVTLTLPQGGTQVDKYY